MADSHTTSHNGSTWDVYKLWEQTRDLPVFVVSIKSLDIEDKWYWRQEMTIGKFAKHAKRAMEADLSYPVMLSPEGRMLDGCHRVVKAMMLGKETVEAVRFEVMPDPMDD